MAAVRTPTGHEDLIHDAQLDYYGLRLATCSSDRLVKVFDVISENGAAPKVQFSCDLHGHTGAVWEVSWAHPRWGNLLASCSYDASVIIHRLNESRVWEEAFRHTGKGSMNSIEWCPYEYGLALACASSDGNVYILRCDITTGAWAVEREFIAHGIGCNSVTWAPYGALGSLKADTGQFILRIATGGADQKVKIFKCVLDQVTGPAWDTSAEQVLEHHQDWVRDVAWAPSIGLPYNLLASCSEDGSVCIWSQETEEQTNWNKEVLPNFKSPVWRVAWSLTGSLLAVSAGDSDVTLWKESLEGKKWVKVSEVKDKVSAPNPALNPVTESAPSIAIAPLKESALSPRQQTAQLEPIQEQTSANSEEPKPSMSWESAPKETAPESQTWSSDQHAQGALEGEQAQGEGSQAEIHDQGYHEEANVGSEQVNHGATEGGYGGYDPQQQQQYYDEQQQQYEGQQYGGQQHYEYAEQGDQQYYEQQGGEGQYWNANEQGQYWDPNQNQGNQYWDPNQQGQQDWGTQEAHDGQQAQGGNSYGLAAPPVNAGATFHQSAQAQHQQQPW